MCASRHAGEAGLRPGGFTLMEILIVLAICVGLVALVTGVYRSVGRSALSLRSGGHEWSVQHQLRSQLLHVFVAPPIAGRQLEGQASELTVFSWHSRGAGSNGKPVLARYHYDGTKRVLYYQEQALPAWWPTATFDLSLLRYQTLQSAPSQLLNGVEDLSFRFLPGDATDIGEAQWRSAWRQDGAPRLVELHFSRAGRSYTLWFETRSADG